MRLGVMRYAPEFRYARCSKAPVKEPSSKDHILVEAVEEYVHSVFRLQLLS